MKEFSVGRRIWSIGILAAGIILMIAALAMDAAGSESAARGPLLVIGLLATLAGIYFFPTLKSHRALVYFLFLFPLLFCFLITVIIPLFKGIGYSFTDWDGVRVRGFVGFANYAEMFTEPGFIWSIIITFIPTSCRA